MWIRSQSLAVLVKANEICIEDKTKIWAEGYLIGKYSTEEKALKVLNEIQNVILKGKAYSSTRGINERHTITNERVAIYLMPADDEVEV